MKEIERIGLKYYICEFCHTEYADKDMALECEHTHKTPVRICQALYNSMRADSKGYPLKIEVMMPDGERVWFKRIRQEEIKATKCNGCEFKVSLCSRDVCLLGSPCPHQISVSNEEWFCSLPTEKKAEQLHMISCISLESKEDDIRWWVDWLKKAHEE